MLYGMAAIFESFNAEARSLFEDTAALGPAKANLLMSGHIAYQESCSTLTNDRGEHTLVIEKSVKPRTILIDPYNLAAWIDPEGLVTNSAGEIDRGKHALVIEKSVNPRAILIKPYNLTFGIDPEGLGKRGAGEVDRGEHALIIQESCLSAEGRP
jgi:hypothetical protein